MKVITAPGLMRFPNFCKCSCGRLHWARNKNVAKATLSRCRSKHPDASALKLKKGKLTPSTTLVMLLSHARAKHHHTKLACEWKACGFKKQLVSFGFQYGKKHGSKRIRGNQLTMYNWRFRWLPALCRKLKANPGLSHVAVCEGNASFDGIGASQIVQAVKTPAKDMHWLGFVKKHRAHPGSWYYDGQPQIEGSKVIIFSRAALYDVHAELEKRKVLSGFCHMDLWLSRTFLARIEAPRDSLFGVRAHRSTSCADTKGIQHIAERKRKRS